MGEYLVRCVSDGSVQPPYALSCPSDNSLLRADYAAKRLELKPFPGIWRFYDWLPVNGIMSEAWEGSVTYRSSGLAAANWPGTTLHQLQRLLARERSKDEDLQLQGAGGASDNAAAKRAR